LILLIQYVNMNSLILIDVIVVLVNKSVSFIRDVSFFSVFHWHVYIVSILSLLHVQWRVSIVESPNIASIADCWNLACNSFDGPHCLVLCVKHFRNVTLELFFLRLNVLDCE